MVSSAHDHIRFWEISSRLVNDHIIGTKRTRSVPLQTFEPCVALHDELDVVLEVQKLGITQIFLGKHQYAEYGLLRSFAKPHIDLCLTELPHDLRQHNIYPLDEQQIPKPLALVAIGPPGSRSLELALVDLPRGLLLELSRVPTLQQVIDILNDEIGVVWPQRQTAERQVHVERSLAKQQTKLALLIAVATLHLGVDLGDEEVVVGDVFAVEVQLTEQLDCFAFQTQERACAGLVF